MDETVDVKILETGECRWAVQGMDGEWKWN